MKDIGKVKEKHVRNFFYSYSNIARIPAVCIAAALYYIYNIVCIIFISTPEAVAGNLPYIDHIHAPVANIADYDGGRKEEGRTALGPVLDMDAKEGQDTEMIEEAVGMLRSCRLVRCMGPDLEHRGKSRFEEEEQQQQQQK